MASPTRWTWVWASSRRRWRTGEPGALQVTGLQSQTQLSGWTREWAQGWGWVQIKHLLDNSSGAFSQWLLITLVDTVSDSLLLGDVSAGDHWSGPSHWCRTWTHVMSKAIKELSWALKEAVSPLSSQSSPFLSTLHSKYHESESRLCRGTGTYGSWCWEEPKTPVFT